MTLRFRQDNTEGYSDADLAALNAAFEEVINANADLWANDTSPSRDLAFKSWQDNVAEEFLFRYDQGRRGDALLTTLRIPGEVARESAMMSPSIPISCRPAFRDDFARHSGMMSLS